MEKYEYEELVERLAKDGYITKQTEEPKAVPQTFFREALEYMQQKYNAADREGKYYGGWLSVWDHIRKAVLWSYNVTTVGRLPLEKQEEANRKAIKMIDALF